MLNIDKNELLASDLMIKGVSVTSRAKQLVNIDKYKALQIMLEGINHMNESIRLFPTSIENRKMRFRHLLGISIESPNKYLKEMEDDFNFFTNKLDSLSTEDKAYYYAVAGDYFIFLGKEKEGAEFLNIAKNTLPGSLVSRFAELSLLKIVK